MSIKKTFNAKITVKKQKKTFVQYLKFAKRQFTYHLETEGLGEITVGSQDLDLSKKDKKLLNDVFDVTCTYTQDSDNTVKVTSIVPLQKTFNARIISKVFYKPPVLGLISKDLGYLGVDLAKLNLSQEQMDALNLRTIVTGTCIQTKSFTKPYHPEKKVKSNWVVTSIKPK